MDNDTQPELTAADIDLVLNKHQALIPLLWELEHLAEVQVEGEQLTRSNTPEDYRWSLAGRPVQSGAILELFTPLGWMEVVFGNSHLDSPELYWGKNHPDSDDEGADDSDNSPPPLYWQADARNMTFRWPRST